MSAYLETLLLAALLSVACNGSAASGLPTDRFQFSGDDATTVFHYEGFNQHISDDVLRRGYESIPCLERVRRWKLHDREERTRGIDAASVLEVTACSRGIHLGMNY